ncbi:non-ribosomal peptide synthetase [Nocardia crassostreae]|uniref:non-ribosomal peptide synthetase n=1 Tax=Nocardia crassostreae TaxID=53428 RepID=UPI00083472BD|nr:non-ribosomal peptide synthetase [Nocardia crassostreae]
MSTGHDLLSGILRQVERVPERTALVVGERSLTYRELDTATAALARRLVAAGVRPGQTVIVYQRQNLDSLIGMIAALRAAAVWCVIEPGHGESALVAVLEAVDCAAVLIDGRDPLTPGDAAAALAAQGGPAVIDIAVVAEPPAVEPLGVEPLGVEPLGVEPLGVEPLEVGLPEQPPMNAPAYAITTSGSTGVPKAVVVSRANLAALIGSRDYPPHIDGELVTFSAMRLIWDGSFMGMAWALTVGGTSVLPDAGMLRDVEAVAELARRHGVSHLVATPSFYRLLLPRLAELRSTLRIVTLGGEAVPPRLIEEHREVLPATRLHNEYGPTEATVTCICHVVADKPHHVVPIGRPSAGTTAHIVDGALRPVRRGTRGDLYLGGQQITDGYAARPGLTATRFVADPFAAEPGARMYLTGDLARVDANGDIEFHGRADSQVKVRGVRIERGAVEAVLEDHPAVREAVVLAATDADDSLYLAAFWVPVDGAVAPPATAALFEHCAERLVPESVPGRFVAVDSLPIAAGSSKLDEAALLALLHAPAERRPAPSRESWTETERALGDIWSEVLLHDEFDRDDRFLDVGGNSHRVVALHMRLEERWPGVISVGLLFDLDTVAAQAAELSADPARPAASAPDGNAPMAFEV